MKDVVIIPAYTRPEYLFVSLTLLLKCKEAPEHHFIIALDQGYSKKCEDVAKQLLNGYSYEFLYNDGSRFRSMKQSYNLLYSYKYAATKTDGLIYLVEDDIFCGLNFFNCHRKLHAKHPDIFCSIASRLNNHTTISEHKKQTLDIFTSQTNTESVYQSLGVCFKADVIRNYIVPHIQPLYFTNPSRYCQENFKKHFLKGTFTEQDGLIRRIADTSKKCIAYPDYPRCYHAGIYGYHRIEKKFLSMNFEQRIQAIIDICFDEKKMMQYNQFNDVFVANVNVNQEIF